MAFWLVLALLTAIASLAVLLPLARPRGAAAPGEAHDLEVYRDQLAEIGRDAARGLIAPKEAEEARAEIGRRILRLSAGGGAGAAGHRPAIARAAGMAAVLAVPLVSWGVYAGIGSPDLPGQPLAARLAKDPAESSLAELVARAEEHLRANPADGRGWDVLAPIYLRLGRAGEAAEAYRNAARLIGPSAQREAGLGEALAAIAGGVVTEEATAAFERALALEPDNAKARFFIASALAQEGRMDEAIRMLRAMQAVLPQESPWRSIVAQALAAAQSRTAAAPGPGPTQEEIDAAAAMSAGERGAMIDQMVAGLDARLRDNPGDAEGWRRLVRSYAVLGRTEEARGALGRGLAALGRDSDEARGLTELAASLGIEEASRQ